MLTTKQLFHIGDWTKEDILTVNQWVYWRFIVHSAGYLPTSLKKQKTSNLRRAAGQKKCMLVITRGHMYPDLVLNKIQASTATLRFRDIHDGT